MHERSKVKKVYSAFSVLCSILFMLTFVFSVDAKSPEDPIINSNKLIQVTDIKYWSNPTYTRIVIHTTGDTSYESRLLKEDPSIQKPRRLFIDLKNAAASPNLKEVPIFDGLLKTVRLGQNTKDTVRVVLDIESIEDYKIFSLESPFRIIVDVMGKGHAELKAKEDIKKDVKQVPLKPSPPRTVKMVLDAGHGGHDPGAVGKNGLQEKDVALKIVKALKEGIEEELRAEIILTRDNDTFITLEERTAIANTKNADVFISVHANASFNREANGVETYYLDLTNDEVAMRVAARENAVSLGKMSDLQYILNDLMKTAKGNESSKLASNVQDALVSTLKHKYSDVKGNGIKGAPFYVLVGTHMPSVLLEVSYISNPKEEARLRDDAYIKEIVKGILLGIKDYLKSVGTDSI